MKLLITGASGLIGYPLTRLSTEKGHQVYATHHRTRPPDAIRIPLDLLQKETITGAFKNANPDAVIHLAAMTDVDRCEKEKEMAAQINHKATKMIAKEAARQDAYLLYVSTDYVFDGSKGRYREDDKPHPINLYGKTKLRGEEAVKEYGKNWGIARTSTPFGSHPHRKTFPTWLIERLSTGEPAKVVVDQYTSPTYTKNLAQMLLEIAERSVEGTIHVSGPDRLSRIEVARAVSRLAGLDETLIHPVEMKDINWLARRPSDSSLDTTKASKLLDNPPEPTQQTLVEFLQRVVE